MNRAANFSWERNLEYISSLLREAKDREDVAQANVEDAVLALLALAETLAFKNGLTSSVATIRQAWLAVQDDPNKRS